MNWELNADNLVNHRFQAYRSAGRVASRKDRDELWFFSPSDCEEILLRSDTFSAKRSGTRDIARSTGLGRMAEFFDDWLMYRDDDLHRHIKREILHDLRKRFSSSPFYPTESIEYQFIQTGDVLRDFVRPYVMRSLSNFFGIDVNTYSQLMDLVEPSIKLLGREDVDRDDLLSADSLLQEGIGLCETLVEECSFAKDIHEHMSKWTQESNATNVLANLVVDGAHPTISALATELLHAYSILGRQSRRSLETSFYRDAPFQYIARRALVDCSVNGIWIPQGKRVIACIGQCGRSDRPHLVFGAGRHACPGKAIAVAIVKSGVFLFGRLVHDIAPFVLTGEWSKSIGYHSLAKLKLEFV